MEERLQTLLNEKFGKNLDTCSQAELFQALMILTKEETQKLPQNQGNKKLYYISAEFLIGKLLSNNLINLGLYEEVEKVLEKHGQKLCEIEELELEPSLQALGSRLQGAIYTPSEEAGDAYLFSVALHERMQNDSDYQLKLNTSVQRFVMEGRDVRAVQTAEGEIQADQFVVASGMGTVPLLRQLGGRPLIYPLKGYSLSLPLEGLNQAVPAISVTDYEQRIVYARLGEVLRMAAMVDIGFDGLDILAARMATLKQQVKDLFPGLPLEQAQTWAGLRPATPSGKPVVGASKLAGRLWVNAGHGALGFTLACGSAAILAAHLTGEASPIDDAPFRP